MVLEGFDAAALPEWTPSFVAVGGTNHAGWGEKLTGGGRGAYCV